MEILFIICQAGEVNSRISDDVKYLQTKREGKSSLCKLDL